MKRKRIRKILIIAFSVCLVAANVTSFTYAVDPVTFTEVETLGATIVDLYGAYNNTSLAYEQLSESGALTEVVTLYNNYASNASDPYTLAAIGAAAAAAGAIAVIYDAVTGQGYIQLYQEQYISSLDGYWDYQLADVGLVRDSITNLFSYYSVNDEPLPVNVFHSSTVNGHELGLLPVRFYTASNDYYDISNTTGEVYYYLVQTPSNRVFVKIGTGQYRTTFKNGNGFNQNMPTSPSNAYGDVYWQTEGAINLNYGTNSSLLPVYSSSTTDVDPATIFGPANTVAIENSNIDIEPSSYIGDPLQNPLEITIPDVSDPNYAPQPRRIKTNIEWDPDWGTPVENPVPGVAYPITDPEILNDAVPGIWESIVSDGVEVGDPDPEPEDPGADANEVTIPFLPITLPSFNLNLSGIWHYVVTWVGSLGDWFTTLFAIWSVLPYAMVVPVYATLVVVIVLGVYRRFLS